MLIATETNPSFYPTPQKTLGILQKISPVFAKTKK
jgi:hypothetical protein